MTRARVTHYKMVLDSVTELFKPNGFRKYNKPDETFRLDFYDGVHYRYMRLDELDQLIDHAVNNESEKERASLAHDLYQWRRDILQDEGHAFFADSRPWARNSGLFVGINLDAFSPFQKRASLQKERTDEFRAVVTKIPQPVKAIPIIDIYMTNRAEAHDPMHVVWSGDMVVVPDLNFLVSQENRLPECVQVLREAMHELATTSVVNMLTEAEIRHDELMQLYGAVPHKVHGMMRNAQTKIGLCNQARVMYNGTQSAIKSSLSMMIGGELVHWSMSARSILDLKAQGRQNCSLWKKDYKGFMGHVRKLKMQHTASMLDETNAFALFVAYQDSVLNLELSFQNNATLDLLTYSQMANFCWQSKYWGLCIKVADVGHSVDVVARCKNQPSVVVTVNTKKMGSGVDSVADTMGNLNNGYGKAVVIAPEVKKFYNSPPSKDHTNSRISDLSMAQLYGSGLPMLANGKIDMEASNHQLTAGTMLIRTEHMKQQSHSDESKAWMANFETTQNDSGQGTGNEKEGWQTTRNMQSRTYIRMFNAPVILIAGNRQDDAFPPSTLGGGRIQSVCSSVMDTAGLLRVSEKVMLPRVSSKGGLKRDRSEEMYDAYLSGKEVKRAKTSSLWTTIQNAESLDTVPVRAVTESMVEQNIRYFFLRHLWRKGMPFLHRTMTLGMVHGNYDLFSSFTSMSMSVRGLTEGLRRSYLVEDTSFKRNVTGPWQTVSAFSTFGMQISDWCSARAIRAGGEHVDLFKSFQDMVRAFLNVPITFTAKISSLHSWLFTNVLDISSMGLFLYMMYVSGFRTYCPLHVLGLVARGHELSTEQWEQYEAFCEAMVHLVTPSVRGLTDRGPLSGLRNVRQGLLREVDRDTLQRWFGWRSNDEGLMAAREARQQDKSMSAFVSPAMLFVSRDKAEWAKRQGFKVEEINEYTAKTPSLFLAHAYAQEQRPESHKTRVEHGQVLLPFHHPHEFWEALHKGTRMPRPDPENGKMDRYELDFQSVWETGYWFEQTISRIGSCRGVMKHFLVLCGLDEGTSLRGLVIALFAPYLQKKLSAEDRSLAEVTFHNNEEWNRPILAVSEAFAWGVQPHSRNRKVEGVEVLLGMRLSHFIVAQGLVCRGWTREKEGYVILASLRNIAHMSLELLMLFVHTRIEKAAIGANNGRIMLPQRSPEATGTEAHFYFDERIHVDSLDNVDDMLCMRARQSSEWTLFEREGGNFIMYGCVSSYRDFSSVSAVELFPFPPESVMHMQTHYMIMSRAHACLASTRQHDAGNDMALAMRLYGCNVQSEEVSYIPVTLTHCVTRGGGEVPCLTYAGGYMFVLRYIQEGEDWRVALTAVEPTHTLAVSEAIEGMCVDAELSSPLFRKLPIGNTVKFSPFMLGDVMNRGLFLGENGEVFVNPCTEGGSLPFFFFPVVNWPHLVALNLERTMATCTVEGAGGGIEDEFVDVHVLPVDEWLDGQSIATDEELEAWFRENRDVPSVSGTKEKVSMIRGEELFCVSNTESGTKRVIRGRNHLKFYLSRQTEARGQGAGKYFEGEWMYCGHVALLGEEVLHFKKTGNELVAEVYDFSNEDYEAVTADIAALKKALNMLEDNIRKTQSEGRPVEELTRVRMQRLLNMQLLKEKVAKCEVKAVLTKRLLFGEDLQTWRMASPPADCDEIELGLVQPHDNGRFLLDGRYRIMHGERRRANSETRERETLMDFVTMSACLVREGQGMWLLLSCFVVRELAALGLRPVTDAAMSDGDGSASDEDEDVMHGESQLQVFYVLGGTERGEHVLSARVRVMVHVIGRGLQALSVRVYDNSGNVRLRYEKLDIPVVSELAAHAPHPVDDCDDLVMLA